MTGPAHPKLLPRDAAVAVFFATMPECMLTLAAMRLRMPASTVHRSIARLETAGLMYPGLRRVRYAHIEEFLIYGVRYAFPPVIGRLADGVPTSLRSTILHGVDRPQDDYVWPVDGGTGRGESLRPLYRTAPELVKRNRRLYETLALVDAIRVHGHARVPVAVGQLRNRITPPFYLRGT